jgi:hypothetical protein
LLKNQERFLNSARQDVEALQRWQSLVDKGRMEFDERYRREYLEGEKFHGFDEALVRLMELLELPGIGKVLSGTLYVLRTPYRLLRGFVGKALSRPESATRAEQPVLEEAFSGWVDMLRKAARRSKSHPLWEHITRAFNTGGLAEQAREKFRQQFREYQVGFTDEVDRTARAIYEDLEKSPGLLTTLRGVKLAFDGVAIGGVLVSGGLNWHDFILVPLAASFTHQLVEVFGKQYVDTQREQARQRQGELLTDRLSGPLAAYLTHWPSTGGSEFERLQLALQRVPGAINQLASAVQAALNQMPAAPMPTGTPASVAAAVPLSG